MGIHTRWWCGREARQRPAKPFTRVRIPSPPRWAIEYWAIGAAVARFPDTEEVTGSNPVSPTNTGGRQLWGEDDCSDRNWKACSYERQEKIFAWPPVNFPSRQLEVYRMDFSNLSLPMGETDGYATHRLP